MASAALPASCRYITAWRSYRNGSRCILILYLPTVSLYYLGKARVCSRRAFKRFYFFAAPSHTSLLPVDSGTGSRLASYLFEPLFHRFGFLQKRPDIARSAGHEPAHGLGHGGASAKVRGFPKDPHKQHDDVKALPRTLVEQYRRYIPVIEPLPRVGMPASFAPLRAFLVLPTAYTRGESSFGPSPSS